MSVTLLLDEHMDLKLADILRRRGLEAVSMQDWLGGRYVGHPDDEILKTAAGEGLTLISYDVHSIPDVLQGLAEERIDHSGVILVSERTVKQNALSALARAIENLVSELGDVDWRNRALFLHR
jgi:predicted nuclease of predicted toxin-antitoxin system